MKAITIHLELKKRIFLYMCENQNEYQLVNSTIEKFREYIYDAKGNYLIGGEDVANFIESINKL